MEYSKLKYITELTKSMILKSVELMEISNNVVDKIIISQNNLDTIYLYVQDSKNNDVRFLNTTYKDNLMVSILKDLLYTSKIEVSLDTVKEAEVITELPAIPVLTDKEKEYLLNVIQPYMKDEENYGIQCITKYENIKWEKFYIVVEMENNRDIYLPYFKKDSDMYIGMKLNQPYTLEELGLIDTKKKLTLTEFWDNKGKQPLAIHCDTEEKANKLLKSFDALGKTWNDGDSYLLTNMYGFYKDKTCYSNEGGYNRCISYKTRLYKIYEFEEVDLDS